MAACYNLLVAGIAAAGVCSSAAAGVCSVSVSRTSTAVIRCRLNCFHNARAGARAISEACFISVPIAVVVAFGVCLANPLVAVFAATAVVITIVICGVGAVGAVITATPTSTSSTATLITIICSTHNEKLLFLMFVLYHMWTQGHV